LPKSDKIWEKCEKGREKMIPKRTFGRTGVEVTRLGLGGEGVLRTYGRKREAADVIGRALDLGIDYFESARAYSGSEAYYGESLRERRKEIFLSSKSHDRSVVGASAHLDETLTNMKTEWLDLWHVHDVRSEADLKEIFGPGGAIEAFDRAKKEGKVRYVGVTGHEEPQILLKAFDLYDFDAVLMPVNPAEPNFLSFLNTVLPEAKRRGMAVIGMKVLCRGLGLQVPGASKAQEWIRYALGHDVSTLVVGCDDPKQVQENVSAAQIEPMSGEEQAAFEKIVAPYARRLMYYK
jgi:aryl-alcohol dehydrogenase-like predicted oxidoreductase